jgi:hypothetical protein
MSDPGKALSGDSGEQLDGRQAAWVASAGRRACDRASSSPPNMLPAFAYDPRTIAPEDRPSTVPVTIGSPAAQESDGIKGLPGHDPVLRLVDAVLGDLAVLSAMYVARRRADEAVICAWSHETALFRGLWVGRRAWRAPRRG